MKAILWQNKDKTVTLIDIPRSIAAAQGTEEEPYTHLLQSSKPLEKPFDIHAVLESKATSENQTSVQSASEADALHQSYCNVLEDALASIVSGHTGQWCLPRPFASQISSSNAKGLKRPHETDLLVSSNPPTDHTSREALPADLFERVVRPSFSPLECGIKTDSHVPDCDYDHDHGSHLWAYTATPATMTLTSHDINTARSTNYNFRLPAKSLVFLGDCSDPQSFHEMLRDAEPWRLQTDRSKLEMDPNEQITSSSTQRDRQKRFDFILLDPPWPNRSVKRTHKTPGTSYFTTKLDNLDAMLCSLDLRSLLSETGYIGIWITNKPAVRKLVLNLFDRLNLQLVEEWVWLKITARGEPSSPLRDTWNGKKPYEVLLVGRSGNTEHTNPGDCSAIMRRVIVGVPDLHSRKPCLKELIEELVGTDDAQVLEVFARYLVAGWWSWGNECLKYNWEGCWQKADEATVDV